VDLLLDTHAFLWWDANSPELGQAASAAIADPDNRVFVSAASAWEIAIKRQLGRLDYTGSPSRAIDANGFTALPITAQQAELVETLPLLHQDPFDRILIAQSLDRNLVLVTADGQIKQYAVALLWAR
jgi:PIN domain nuclease of toxin-antitoxin system